jgi:succinoglycan biosynthesis protein ExoL
MPRDVSQRHGLLLVFAHEGTDARVIKRHRAFSDFGWQPVGFTFHRPRPGCDASIPFRNIDLGTTRDRAYAHRLFALLRALRILWRERDTLRAANALYAINVDNALLALASRWFAGRPIPLFLEIADLQPPFLHPGLQGRLLRWIERRVLARAAALITTSPAFLREYFVPRQHFSGSVFILENKVYPTAGLDSTRDNAPSPPPPWRIGWFGAFRCQRSWEAVRALARRHPDTLHFVLRGYPTAIHAEEFAAQARELPNIEFTGPYHYPDDLPAMHQGLHFVWGFDFSDTGGNSQWLLPNRLYESGFFGVPMLAAAGTETGRRLATTGTGAAVELESASLADDVSAFLASLTPETWRSFHRALAAQPRHTFAGEEDAAALSATVASAVHPDSHAPPP